MIKHGQFVADLSSKNMVVSYFDFTTEGTQGPYLIYFQLDYEIRQEGPVALVLSKYLQEEMIWAEVGLYTLLDNQSTVLRVIEKGVYGISI